MPLSSIALIVLFALLASLIQRVSGFGFGIFIMTVLPHLLPSYAEATALSGLLAIVASLGPAVVMYRHLEWKKLLPILITFIVVSFLFVRSSKDPSPLKKQADLSARRNSPGTRGSL